MSEQLPTTKDETAQDADITASEATVVTGPGGGDVKDIDVAGEEHPLVEETGGTILEKQTAKGAGEFLSDYIYESDEAWVREWLQNHETACVRAAKLAVKQSDQYPDGWLTLTRFVDEGGNIPDRSEIPDPHSDEETDLRVIEIPRPINEVIEAAKTLGYKPKIAVKVFRDERKIITYDNGIGMTPKEYDEAFNTIFKSGSGVDGETGGQFGVGSESQALVTGKEGGATVKTRSRRPGDYDGFFAYSYLGGSNPMSGTMEDDFYGTRFELPVQEAFDLSQMKTWMDRYAEMLRVPVKYEEHDAGRMGVDEEYEASDYISEHGNPPVAVERPGEFSVVAGADVYDNSYDSDDANTYLVSMRIERNTKYRISSLWNTVVQIHDEQGRIIAGPNRGRYSDGTYVYPTSDKRSENRLGELHTEDVKLPEPTGSRDSLEQTGRRSDFWRHVQKVVQSEEKKRLAEIAERVQDNGIVETIQENQRDWKLFQRMLSQYGIYEVPKDNRKTEKWLQDNDVDELPDFTEDQAVKIRLLFRQIDYCRDGRSFKYQTKKKKRREKKLGQLLAEKDPSSVWMAASTSGNFVDYAHVAEHNDSDATVIVVSKSSRYSKYGDAFGFNVLKELPLTKSDDHDWDVPQSIHGEHSKSQGATGGGKPDELEERTMKIRTSDGSKVNWRPKLKRLKDILGSDDTSMPDNDRLVVFTRGGTENISDHYDLGEYANIVSMSKTEYAEVAHFDDVMKHHEFRKWSRGATFNTTEGEMSVHDIVHDDRLVVVAYAVGSDTHEKIEELASDEKSELRELYLKDIRNRLDWPRELDGYEGGYRGDEVSDIAESDLPDTLLAWADKETLIRSRYAMDNPSVIGKTSLRHFDVVGLRFSITSVAHPISFKRLDGSTKRYKLKVDTPNWDNDSDVYNYFGRQEDEMVEEILLSLHDRGIDPTEMPNEDIRGLI